MKLFQLLALSFVGSLAWVGRAQEVEETSDDSDVHVLKSESFEEFIEKYNHTLVMFHAPWCGHCKSLMPHFNSAATKLKSKPEVALAKVDATVETDLATKYDIKGYPTLKFFSNNGDSIDYAGGRTAETMVEWIENMMGPAVTQMKEEEVSQHKDTILIVARVKKSDNKAAETYTKLAEKKRLSAKFGMIVDEAAKDEATVYRPSDEPVSKSIGNDVEVLQKWFDEEKFPFFGPIDGDTYAAYEERGKEMVWFAGTDKDFEKHGAEIRIAAKKFRDTYSFVWVDTVKFGAYVESGLGLAKTPGIVIRMPDGGRYLYPEGQAIEGKKLIKFLEDVQAGKVEKFLKSEPIPETNDEPVKIVVGKNFDEMMFDAEKDVMLMVYAPWCGHCKRLEPSYVKLATQLEGVKHVRIAKMDGTTNEPPSENFQFKGFPTIFWVKAGEKMPKTYEGARTIEGLLTYIKENSHKAVNIELSKEDKEEDKKEEL